MLPYTILKLVELGRHVFPPGVFQALGGDERVATWLAGHAGVTPVDFADLSMVGERVRERAVAVAARHRIEAPAKNMSVVRRFSLLHSHLSRSPCSSSCLSMSIQLMEAEHAVPWP